MPLLPYAFIVASLITVLLLATAIGHALRHRPLGIRVKRSDEQAPSLEDRYILIANQKIGSVRDVLPVLERVIQAGNAESRTLR